MDRAAEMAGGWSLEPLKEPRGFIKILEFILAIFAFATTTSHYSKSSFIVQCPTKNVTQELPFGYAYRLSSTKFDAPLCNETTFQTSMFMDCSSSAEFYVFVGVMAFLYSLAAIIFYVGFDDKYYRKYDKIPSADFVVTAIFALLWLIGSSVWADGVIKVKYYTDPSNAWLSDAFADCKQYPCHPVLHGNFASLNVSIIFGFLNMCVWGGNLWFLFKETKWFKVQSQHPELTRDDALQPKM